MAGRDPSRWSVPGAGAPAEIRGLLEHARGDLPDDGEMRALGLTSAAVLAACAAGAGAGTAIGAGATASAPKLALAGGGAPAAGSSAGAGTAALSASSLLFGVGLLVASGVGVTVWQVTSSPTAARQPSSAVPTQIAETQAAENQSEQTPRAQMAPVVADPPIAAPEPVASVAPAEPLAAEAPGRPQGKPRHSGADVPKAVPRSEVSLLREAQRALAIDSERALALTREHRARFSTGSLVQEREVIRIEALRRLGRLDEARHAERGFEKRFPDSAHRPKVGVGKRPESR